MQIVLLEVQVSYGISEMDIIQVMQYIQSRRHIILRELTTTLYLFLMIVVTGMTLRGGLWWIHHPDQIFIASL